MEYFVFLKNPFALNMVVTQLRTGSWLQNSSYNWNFAFAPTAFAGIPFKLSWAPNGPGPSPYIRPRFEDANIRLYDWSAKGGTFIDYFVIGDRTLVCYPILQLAYWQWPKPAPVGKITQQDLVDTAKQLGIEPEVMMAIARQESHGGGFFKNGQPKILFERHRMYALLKQEGFDAKALEKQYPNLVNHVQGGYGPSSTQHARLEKARAIDERAALQSASWGRFQVMGENYRDSYTTPQEMEKAMRASEKQQLDFFASFLRHKAGGKLIKALNAHQWETVAMLYNGSHWRKINPNYATNIAKYYREFKQHP